MPQEYKLILKHIDQPGYTPDVECYLRCGGYETLTFKAKTGGETTLKLAYCHPWECTNTTEKTKVYAVSIEWPPD